MPRRRTETAGERRRCLKEVSSALAVDDFDKLDAIIEATRDVAYMRTVRLTVADGLRATDSPRGVAILAQLLRDESSVVRGSAMRGLVSSRRKEAQEALIRHEARQSGRAQRKAQKSVDAWTMFDIATLVPDLLVYVLWPVLRAIGYVVARTFDFFLSWG